MNASPYRASAYVQAVVQAMGSSREPRVRHLVGQIRRLFEQSPTLRRHRARQDQALADLLLRVLEGRCQGTERYELLALSYKGFFVSSHKVRFADVLADLLDSLPVASPSLATDTAMDFRDQVKRFLAPYLSPR